MFFFLTLGPQIIRKNKISMYMIEHKINMTFLLNLSSISRNRYMRNLETSFHSCFIYAVPSILSETEYNLNKSSGIFLVQK